MKVNKVQGMEERLIVFVEDSKLEIRIDIKPNSMYVLARNFYTLL